MVSAFRVILCFFLEVINYFDILTKPKTFWLQTLKIKGKNFAVLCVFEDILGEICCHSLLNCFALFSTLLWKLPRLLIFEIGRFWAKTPYLGSNFLNREQLAELLIKQDGVLHFHGNREIYCNMHKEILITKLYFHSI